MALHRTCIRAALAGGHLFAWVFAFHFFYVQQKSVSLALVSVLLAYALTHVIALLLTPVSARMLRHGYKRVLAMATLALSLSFVWLATAFSGALGDISLGIALFAIFTGIYRALYWTPYALSDKGPYRRKEWVEIVIALMPLLSGLYLTNAGTPVVTILYAAAIVSVLSVIPTLSLRDHYEGFAWTYRGTFHELFDPRYRPVFWGSFFSGVESATLFLLWPLAIFTFLDWSYPLLGVVMSLTLIFTMVARKLFGRAVEMVPASALPFVAASGWVMRMGASGFVGAVLIDTYFHTAGRSNLRGIDVHAQEHAADNSTYIDEFTALKEMSMALGRTALCLAAAALFAALTVPFAFLLAFIFAAFAAGLSVFYSLSARSSSQ